MNQLYTRMGDDGTTALFGQGSVDFRIYKSSPQIELLGTVDEANSFVGLAHAALGVSQFPFAQTNLSSVLRDIMRDLFEVGTYVGAVHPKIVEKSMVLHVNAARVQEIEGLIDQATTVVPRLTNFIFPTGSAVGAALFTARSVIRRAEREYVRYVKDCELDDQELSPPAAFLPYLNRLGDLLFVLGRVANQYAGAIERVWKPEKPESA